MKVYIQYRVNNTGKGKFLGRLLPAFDRLGVEYAFKEKGCDVALGFTRWRKRPPQMPRVLRVDGIHLVKGDRERYRNALIKDSIKKSHLVIWQSHYARFMCKRSLSVQPRADTVIYNGADPKDYDVEPIQSPYPKNVILSAKWMASNQHVRKHKRLKDSIKIARHYTTTHPDVCFWIAGRWRELAKKHPRVVYLGLLKEPVLKRYLKMADVMLYLAYYDWCPNAVVEAMAAGAKIVSGNNGGHAEFAHYVTQIDEPIRKYELKNRTPPMFKFRPVIEQLDTALANTNRPKLDERLHIDTVAKQYVEALRKARACKKN